MNQLEIAGVDLFCGVGGLTHGLRRAGIQIVAGVDTDPACEFPFVRNNGVCFVEADVREISGEELAVAYPKGSIRLLAGCAPCQPFSPFRRRMTNKTDADWGLLDEFGRIVRELRPELVTMENVPDLASQSVFKRFLSTLFRLGYLTDWSSVYCPRFGVPQHRRRLVLLASRIGCPVVPKGSLPKHKFRTVRHAIGDLPSLMAGGVDPRDAMHKSRAVSAINLKRLKASRPGGTWQDWPEALRARCHRRKSGGTYKNVYARMAWDEPAPTITTLAYSFGSGRFGHPEQDRSITLREAAMLQSFPRHYKFVEPGQRVEFAPVGRLIGNAVPPLLSYAIGVELLRIADAFAENKRAC